MEMMKIPYGNRAEVNPQGLVVQGETSPLVEGEMASGQLTSTFCSEGAN